MHRNLKRAMVQPLNAVRLPRFPHAVVWLMPDCLNDEIAPGNKNSSAEAETNAHINELHFVYLVELRVHGFLDDSY